MPRSSAVAAGRALVSIVVTNHNYGRYVGEAIDSALAQTYEPVEVIVIDDGSTDGSRAVIDGFGDRIRAACQPNAGQASALNAGFRLSRGRLVLFLDADDRLAPDAATRLAAAWRPGVARIHGRATLIDDAGRPRGGRLPADPLPSGDVRPLILRSGDYPTTGTTGVAFDRRCLATLMPIPVDAWRDAPDSYLRLLSPFTGRVAAVDGPVGEVRIHGRNNWSMSSLDPGRLAEHLERDVRKDALLRTYLLAGGVDLRGDWLRGSPTHLQSRLALLRLDPGAHPFPGDRAWTLGLRGATAALRQRAFTTWKRWSLAAWFLAVGLLPGSASRPLIEAAYIRTRRPLWLRRLLDLGFGGRPARGAG